MPQHQTPKIHLGAEKTLGLTK